MPSENIAPLITADALSQRIAELATRSAVTSPDEDLHLMCVLKGAVMFLADLVRAMDGGVTMDFMALSSYAAARPRRAKCA